MLSLKTVIFYLCYTIVNMVSNQRRKESTAITLPLSLIPPIFLVLALLRNITLQCNRPSPRPSSLPMIPLVISNYLIQRLYNHHVKIGTRRGSNELYRIMEVFWGG